MIAHLGESTLAKSIISGISETFDGFKSAQNVVKMHRSLCVRDGDFKIADGVVVTVMMCPF